jgi:hypothetical protein
MAPSRYIVKIKTEQTKMRVLANFLSIKVTEVISSTKSILWMQLHALKLHICTVQVIKVFAEEKETKKKTHPK